MNPFWTQVIIQTTLRHKSKKPVDKKGLSNYRHAKSYREFLITLKRHIKDFILITIGIFSASFGFKGSTAAGDTFNGALAVAIAEGKSLTEAVAFGNQAAAISVTRLGAQTSVPYLHELTKNN